MNFQSTFFNTASSTAPRIRRILELTPGLLPFLTQPQPHVDETLRTVPQFSSKYILHDAPPPLPPVCEGACVCGSNALTCVVT